MITARFLYGEHFEFKPQFKIWLRGNHKPIITDSSEGAWRRIRLVPFENQIPLDKRDYGLEKKILSEKEGILNWMIEGCLLWQKQKLTKLPQRIDSASQGYREESDVLAEFIEEQCLVDGRHSAEHYQLFAHWEIWCEKNGLQSHSLKSFTRQLGSRGFNIMRKKENGKIVKYYKGLYLPDPFKDENHSYDSID